MPTTEEPPTAVKSVTRGREVYDRLVHPHMRPEDDGKFVAVDMLTGEYELDADEIPAVRRLRARAPGAEVVLLCVGQPGTYRI